MDCGDLSDEGQAVISPLLPPEQGRSVRPAHDNRRFLNEMLCVLRGVVHDEMCMSAIAAGTRYMCGSGAGPSRVSGTRCCNHSRPGPDGRLAPHDRQHDGSRPQPAVGAKGGTHHQGFGRSRNGFTSKSMPGRTVRDALLLCPDRR